MEYDLTKMRKAANAACEKAAGKKHRKREAVNWARVACTSAEHYKTDAGKRGYRVWIIKAAPDAYRFRAFVCDELASAGFGQVEVMTEW